MSNESVSFLSRARQHYLGRIPDAHVEAAFAKTVEEGGKSIGGQALEMAVQAIQGFPYMMQLVGYFSWMLAADAEELKEEHVKEGLRLAQKDFESGVLDATYRELSPGDRNFLVAMLEDDRESKLSDIAQRMGKSNGYASSYKSRLLNQGVIEELPGRGLVFSMPFFREYLVMSQES